MILKQFIKEFVCTNTLIRLWSESTDQEYTHYMLGDTSTDRDFERRNTVMEWEILDGTRMKMYSEYEVVGVTDIYCDHSPEAVNIVIREGMNK